MDSNAPSIIDRLIRRRAQIALLLGLFVGLQSTRIFIFEVLSSCRWISVAYSPRVGSVSVAFLHRKDRVGDQAVRLLVHPCGRPWRRARRPGCSDRAAGR